METLTPSSARASGCNSPGLLTSKGLRKRALILPILSLIRVPGDDFFNCSVDSKFVDRALQIRQYGRVCRNMKCISHLSLVENMNAFISFRIATCFLYGVIEHIHGIHDNVDLPGSKQSK